MCNFSQRTGTDLNAYFMKILACKQHKLYSSIFSLQVIFVHSLDVDNYYLSTLMRPFTCSCVCTRRNTSWPMWRSGSNIWRLVLFFQLIFNEVALAISAPLLFLCLPAPSWITYARHNIQLLMWAAENKLMVLGLCCEYFHLLCRLAGPIYPPLQ